MKHLFALALAAFLPAASLAEEHLPGTVRGEGIELSELDHAMAGAVHGHPVYAAFSESAFTAKLLVRSREADVVLEIADADGKYRGEMRETWMEEGAERELSTSIEFVRIERTETLDRIRIHLLVNGAPTVAEVRGESFANGHFQAPEFTVTGAAAEPFRFKFTGQTCFGYSINMAMLVTAAYVHLGSEDR